jgi:hypothetical protein
MGWRDRVEYARSGSNPQANKGLAITGLRQLASDLIGWEQIVKAISSVMHGNPEESEA